MNIKYYYKLQNPLLLLYAICLHCYDMQEKHSQKNYHCFDFFDTGSKFFKNFIKSFLNGQYCNILRDIKSILLI